MVFMQKANKFVYVEKKYYLCSREKRKLMLTAILSQEQLHAVSDFISGHTRFAVLTHTSPDGDAMGSSLAMRHYLKDMGKQAQVIVPNAFPTFLEWLPGAAEDLNYETQKAEADKVLDEVDAIICTDFNELKRINSLGEKILALRQEREVPILMIDHHIVSAKEPPVADILLSYPESPSASEIVYRVIHALSGAIGQLPSSCEIATCIYCGMMTDTGNFSFNSNYPEMYEIVGDLVRLGVNKDQVYNRVFNQYSVGRMRLMGYCLYEKMRLYKDYHLALITLKGRELYRFQFQSGDAEGLVNLPLQIDNIYYSCFMRQDKVAPSEVAKANGAKTKIKISFRSQGDRPVNIFAHDIFHGGGHANAAGGEYYGKLEDAVKLFLENYPKYLKKD